VIQRIIAALCNQLGAAGGCLQKDGSVFVWWLCAMTGSLGREVISDQVRERFLAADAMLDVV
jgi:hypothetical protein